MVFRTIQAQEIEVRRAMGSLVNSTAASVPIENSFPGMKNIEHPRRWLSLGSSVWSAPMTIVRVCDTRVKRNDLKETLYLKNILNRPDFLALNTIRERVLMHNR